MNTWRDIKTAPKHQPVLVTVEGIVCFGRFCDFEDEDYSGLAFDGACLSDGESVSYFADYIDGWQPAPATFQPEKTADEMSTEHNKQKQTALHNAIAEMRLIDTDRPEKKYLEFRGLRYVFEDGRYVGWYNPEGPNE